MISHFIKSISCFSKFRPNFYILVFISICYSLSFQRCFIDSVSQASSNLSKEFPGQKLRIDEKKVSTRLQFSSHNVYIATGFQEAIKNDDDFGGKSKKASVGTII